MNNQRVNEVTDGNLLIAHIFNFGQPGPVIFPTPDHAEMQCGFGQVVADKFVLPHVHNVVDRQIRNTSEFIYVIDGSMEVFFLDPNGQLISRANIGAQQGFLQYTGGHKITISAGTRYFELKQGPYLGQEKDKTVLQNDPTESKSDF